MKDLDIPQIYGKNNRDTIIHEDWIYFSDLHRLFPKVRVIGGDVQDNIIENLYGSLNGKDSSIPKIYVIDNDLSKLFYDIQNRNLYYIFLSDFYNDYSKKYLNTLSEEEEDNFLELFELSKNKSEYCEKIFNTLDILTSDKIR